MTTIGYFLPMPRAVILVFEGVQTLDATGPAEVFAKGGYEVIVASTRGGVVHTTAGIALGTRALASLRAVREDTIVVAGGGEAAIAAAIADRGLRAWLVRAARTARRIASVCSGAFILAAVGLLDGKRAATHWSALDRLERMFPAVTVDRCAIYVVDGTTWTSAGVTTGIDMALAIVEDDRDRALADQIAANLVLYVRRPGYQSQWSEALVAQGASLGPTIAWARSHLATVDLEGLARRAGMSPRTFHRRCLAQLGTTPAKLLDKLRVERARDLLEARSEPSLKVVAARCGWTSPIRMTRAFERELGLAPRSYRLLHATRAST